MPVCMGKQNEELMEDLEVDLNDADWAMNSDVEEVYDEQLVIKPLGEFEGWPSGEEDLT